jgi:hypothetical protein
MKSDTPSRAPADLAEDSTSLLAVVEPPKPTRKRIAQALRNKHRADGMDHWADRETVRRDRIAGLGIRHDAQLVRDKAEADLSLWAYTTATPQRGNGGELVPLPEPEDPQRRMVKKSTVQEPAGVLEHDASSQAMDLVANVDVLSLALDTANSVKAKNRAERLLCHQAAAMHKLGMDFVVRAQNEIGRANRNFDSGNTQYRQIANVEAARAANAAARAFSAFSDAMLTMQKLRTGGKQVVKVIHQQVQVNDGGKAVVAGSIGRKSRKTGGGRRGADQG